MRRKTGAHRADLADGIVLYVCERCGGFYRTEEQASYASLNSWNEKGHACRARPKN